jgi:endonuclease/exonuclease/phosphatase (EEP) superfamily protein YafD
MTEHKVLEERISDHKPVMCELVRV